MAKGHKVRDNFSRFQKYATINLTKHLQEVANETGNTLREDIAGKLLETYRDSVIASYIPSRSTVRPYDHTGTLLESISVKIEDTKVRIHIDGRKRYKKEGPKGKSKKVTQIYEYLTEGTDATNKLYRYKDSNGKIQYAYDLGTPEHNFEEVTQAHMLNYLHALKQRIDDGTYSNEGRR